MLRIVGNADFRIEGVWRRKRDSNPRAPFDANGFQDRRFQPLTHSSATKVPNSPPNYQ